MVVSPLIFLVIVTGIAKVGSMKALGKIGGKALLWFTAATTFALGLGLLVGNLVKPGSGLNIDPATLDTSALDEKTQGGHLPGGVEFVMHIIPTSVFDAFAQNNLLQVLLFAILFGVALASFSESAPPILMDVIDQTLHVIFRIVGYIMYLAPLGAFGAMAFTVGNYGAGSLKSFGVLILACYGAALVFIVVLSIVVKLITGVNAWKFIKYCREEFMLALGTGSSEAVMPRIIKKLDNAGCDRAVVGLVIPTGYSFNLDGAAIYLSLAMMFLAQAVGWTSASASSSRSWASSFSAPKVWRVCRGRPSSPYPRPLPRSARSPWPPSRCCSAPTGSWTPCAYSRTCSVTASPRSWSRTGRACSTRTRCERFSTGRSHPTTRTTSPSTRTRGTNTSRTARHGRRSRGAKR